MSLIEIKSRIKEVPVSSIIGQYVNLHKKGANFNAICPFHSDKNPSLVVSDQKGLFRCFACDIGGDSITFVSKFLSLNFKESLLEIAKTLGISIDYLNDEVDPKFNMAKKLLKASCELYRRVAKSKKYPEFDNFIRDRKLKEETVEQFTLGYAPGNNALLYYINSLSSAEDKKKYIQVALEIGLLREGQKDKEGRSSIYDTFRERIIFPIWDSFHNCVGFGSRAVHSYQKAKYINSQESFIFNKRKIMYGHNFAKSSIRQKNQVVLVEGYMDLIAMHQAGVDNSVAVMGVALSEENISVLKSQSTNVYLALDSDNAGKMAMDKMQQGLFRVGIIPRYLDFSPYKDPDEFINGEGQQAVIDKIKVSKPLLEKDLQSIVESSEQCTSEEKLVKLNEVFLKVSALGDSLLASETVISTSQRLGLQSSSAQVVESYKNFLSTLKTGSSRERYKDKSIQSSISRANEAHAASRPGVPANKVVESQERALTAGEKILLRELLQHPECLCEEQLLTALELLEQNDVKTFIYWLKDLYYEIDDSEFVAVILEYLTKNKFSLAICEMAGSALFNYDSRAGLEDKVKAKLIRDLSALLQKENLLRMREKLREEQKESSTETDVYSILSKLHTIEMEMNKIKLAK